MPELNRDCVLLQELSEAELELLGTIAEERRFAAGEAILRQGEAANAIGLVHRGRVRVSAILGRETDGGQEEEVLVRLGPGEVLGELSFVTGEPANVSVLADEDVVVMSLPNDRLNAFLVEQPEIARKLLLALARVLVSRLRQTGKELVLARYFQRT